MASSASMEISISIYLVKFFMKALCFLPFIRHWMANYPPLSATHSSCMAFPIVIFTLIQALPFFQGLLLLSLISLHMRCTFDAISAFVDAAVRAANPTGSVLLTRCGRILNHADFFIMGCSALGFLLACLVRCCSFFEFFPMYLLSLDAYFFIRLAAVAPGHDRARKEKSVMTSTKPLDLESSLGSIPTWEPEKVECKDKSSIPSGVVEEEELEEKTSNLICGSLDVELCLGSTPSGDAEDIEFEKSLVKDIVPLNMESSSNSIPLEGEKTPTSNSTSSDEWFHIERDGMEGDGDGEEINERFKQLLKHLHHRLL